MTTAEKFGRLREVVTDGPLTTYRGVHHLVKVGVGILLTWPLVWFGLLSPIAAGIVTTVFIMLFKFFPQDYTKGFPPRISYGGPRSLVAFLHYYNHDSANDCSLHMFGAFVVVGLVSHPDMRRAQILVLLGVLLLVIYWHLFPEAEP